MFRPVLTPVLARARRSVFGSRTAGVELDELVTLTERHLSGRTLTRPELGRLLAERWPAHEGSALSWSAQYLMPLVHPPPDGVWRRRRGRTPLALAADWLGSPVEAAPVELIRRYLAAFGPATVRDLHQWSGLSRLGDVVESMDLCRFRTEAGVALYDLPAAPRPGDPGPAAAAARLRQPGAGPPRPHPRHVRRAPRPDLCRRRGGGHRPGGRGGGRRLVRGPDTTTVHVTMFEGDPEPVVAEAYRLLAFAAPDTTHEVRL